MGSVSISITIAQDVSTHAQTESSVKSLQYSAGMKDLSCIYHISANNAPCSNCGPCSISAPLG